MNNYIFISTLSLFLLVSQAYALVETTQRPATDANVYGHVINAETGEHISFINLIVEGTRIGTITDVSGHYILTNLPVGRHRLIVQGMGYETAYTEFEAVARKTIEVDLAVLPTAIRLDEIVFTASPTQSGFRYQPDQTFLSEDLQRRAEASFGEMLNTEPGISMRSMGSMPSRPVIRGLDGDRILILQNGERMGDISETSADHSLSLDPLAASRVEVVRGPASLLYGSSALGGVINLMTTDIPDDTDPGTSGVLSLHGATVNDMGAGFGRLTHNTGSLAGSVRFSYRQAGNVKTPDGVLYGTSFNNYDGATGIGFNRPGANGGISLSMTGQTYEIPEAIDDPDETVEIRMQRIGMHGRLNMQRQGFFDKSQIRFNASRMHQGEFEMERENGEWEEDLELEYTKLTFSSTATLQHKAFRMLDRGAVGLNFYAHSMDVEGDDAYTPGEDRINLGIFTFQELPLSSIFRFQAGLRIDMQHTAARTNYAFPLIDSRRTAYNYSGSVGFNHRPRQGIEVGGQFARSHRNPSVEELFANGPHLGAGVFEIGNSDLKDEIGHGADFFIRFENQSVEIEFATFINSFMNFIIFQPAGRIDEESGFPVFKYEGDEARLMGGEIRIWYRPSERFVLNAGIDYVEGMRLTDDRQHLPFMPPLRYTGSIEYDFGKAWTGLNMQLVNKQNQVAPDEEITHGYMLLGAQIGFRADAGGRHVIILRADNLLDTAYRDHLSRIEDRNFPMPGRNFNLSYRWFF